MRVRRLREFRPTRQYSLKILLANPQQVKTVTGHKTDPHDARWLAHLLRHGMIRPSFIPPRPIRALRDFTRRRKQMIGLQPKNGTGCRNFWRMPM